MTPAALTNHRLSAAGPAHADVGSSPHRIPIFRFTRISWSRVIPALFTRMSMRPCCPTAAAPLLRRRPSVTSSYGLSLPAGRSTRATVPARCPPGRQLRRSRCTMRRVAIARPMPRRAGHDSDAATQLIIVQLQFAAPRSSCPAAIPLIFYGFRLKAEVTMFFQVRPTPSAPVTSPSTLATVTLRSISLLDQPARCRDRARRTFAHLGDQPLDDILPAHRQRHLPNQRLDAIGGLRLGPCIDIGHDRDARP